MKYINYSNYNQVYIETVKVSVERDYIKSYYAYLILYIDMPKVFNIIHRQMFKSANTIKTLCLLHL